MCRGRRLDKDATRDTTQVSVIKVKVNVAKKETLFPLNYLSLLRPVDTELCILEKFSLIKRQLEIVTLMSVINIKVTVA